MKSVCSLGEDTLSMLEQRTAKHDTLNNVRVFYATL